MCNFHLRNWRNHGNPPADASCYTAGKLEQRATGSKLCLRESMGGEGRAVKLKHPAGGALPSTASVCSLPQPQTGSLNPVKASEIRDQEYLKK